MTIKFLGQNCFLFTYEGTTILSDPFYNIQKEKSGFEISKQTIDYILITHAHQDHIDDVKEVLDVYPNANLIAQPEICGHFNHKHNIDLNYGGSTKIKNLEIAMLPALHTSSFPDGSYGGNPCGYMFKFPDKNLYFAGDTGVMADMEMFPRLYGKIDLAILPVGDHYTMGPKNAAFAAAKLLELDTVIGCHFDTFEAIKIDHEYAKKIFLDKRVNLILPELGEEIKF